jgi:ribose transport system ATP-binding protein
VAYVSGDRQVEGIFQFWPVARNISVGVMPRLSRGGLVNTRGERTLAREWAHRLQIRGGADSPVTTLSGGNQQKVLVARALASDAKIILFDDPTRGVDVGTKRQLYEMVYQEARAGRCFIWYTTEGDELRECDRVYVFRAGRIVDEVRHGAISEDRIIAASFREVGGVGVP